MPISLRSLTAAALIATTAPASAQEGQPPAFWSFLTVEYVATTMVHTALSWARVLADIRYDQVSVDPFGLRVTLTGMEISPYLPGRPDGSCVITVERATVNGAALDRLGDKRIRIALDGAEVGAGCLPPPAAGTLRALGFSTLRAGELEADILYDYASGGMQLRATADLDRLAAVTLNADIAYFSYRMDFQREEPVVAVDLNSAEITIQDQGGWDMAQNFMPAELKVPGMLGPVMSAAVVNIIAEGNGAGVTASERQQAFAEQVGQVANAFVDGKRRVVLATRIEDAPFRLSEASLRSFQTVFDRLNPTVGQSAPAVAQVIAAAELDAALKQETPPANAMALGRALITGIGAPRNTNGALRLLVPLARQGNAEASLLIAGEIAQSNPGDAYAHALRAAASGLPGALSLLDRIERALPYQTALDAQKALMSGPNAALFGDVTGMRQAARAFLTGTERPRSWQAAYYWASMAAAAGDASGAALRDDITELMRLRGDAEIWATEAKSLENGVLRDWLSKDVPALLR